MKVLMIGRTTLYKVPGGDTVQTLETAEALRDIGLEVDVKLTDESIDYQDYDLIHFFNIIRPHNIQNHIQKAKLPYVISTVFVDYSEIEKSHSSFLIKMLYRIFGTNGVSYFKVLARFLANGEKIVDFGYLFRGHKKAIESVLRNASFLLPNSKSEYYRLKKAYRLNCPYTVIPNAVSDDFINRNLNALMEEKREGVVCVARIEIIKNQLNLIKALNNTGIKLKLIGKPAPNHIKYYKWCKQIASDNIEFLGQMDKKDVISELAKAKVHVLPSYFETTGLSSLEALALGCNVVVTRKGDAKEYFESIGFFCDPDDPNSIRSAIQSALDAPLSDRGVQFVKEKYTWKHAALKTKEVYENVLNKNE